MGAPAWLSGMANGKRRRNNFCTTFVMIGASFMVACLCLYTLTYLFSSDGVSVSAPQVDSPNQNAPAVDMNNDQEKTVEADENDNDSSIDTDYSVGGQQSDPVGYLDGDQASGKTMKVEQPVSSNPLSWDYDAYNAVKFGMRPNQTFHSSNIKTPFFQVNTFKPRATEGHPYLFFTPAISGQKNGIQIFSRKDLSLVYAEHGWDGTLNIRAQEYNNKQYLTFWAGKPVSGHGQGYGIMFDDHYEQTHNLSINTLRTKADSHEFQLTHDGGALMTAYETKPWDMSPVGGPKEGVLQDSCFEEVDIETNETRFSWCASKWFSVTETTVGYNDDTDYGHPTREGGWDFFHINSMEKTKDGNYLVSGRRLCLLVLINGKTGEPIWQLGGKKNQFKDLSDGRATKFGYQHHARFDNEDNTEIVFFDNGHLVAIDSNPGCKDQCSRGMHVKLDFEAMTAELVKSYWHPKSVRGHAEGSTERQSNGNVLVGWGKVPGFTEFARDGEVLLDVQTGPWVTSKVGEAHLYRIYSMDWKAYPTWDPAIAVFEGDVFVSYNGATELANWVLYTGDDAENMQPQYVVYRGGFETKLPLRTPAPFARVAALDKDGNVIGSTDVIEIATGEHTKVDAPLQFDYKLE